VRIRYLLAGIAIGAVVLGLNVYVMAYRTIWPSSQVRSSQIICPLDNDPYVWTPLWDENAKWICLRDGHSWSQSYPADVYQKWQRSILSPEYVRDYTILYLRQIENKTLPDPLETAWIVEREVTEDNQNQTRAYQADGVVVTLVYPIAESENMTYAITVQSEEGVVVWQGQLFWRQFIAHCECEVHP
jgi:hypothetical protein